MDTFSLIVYNPNTMDLERKKQIAASIDLLNRKVLNHRPGKRNGGFKDETGQTQLARMDALTHRTCSECAHLLITISDGNVGLRCAAEKSPAQMWEDHRMIGAFGTEPQCDTFTSVEETRK